MSLGPGKYDDLCTLVREMAQAKACVLIIGDGARGHGFSAQIAVGDLIGAIEVTQHLAKVLRDAADQMQADARRMRRTLEESKRGSS